MGVMSRRVLPVCGNLGFFCPSLRARSRQPVKRYKKLLANSFPRSQNGEPNERMINKLCDALLVTSPLPCYQCPELRVFPCVSNSSSIFSGPPINSIEVSPVPIRMQDGIAEEIEPVHGITVKTYHQIPMVLGHHSARTTSFLLHRIMILIQQTCWPPCLILREKCEWDRNKSDVLDPDFPSPAYSILRKIQIRRSNLSIKRSSKQLLDVQASEGTPSSIFDLSSKCISGASEPLF